MSWFVVQQKVTNAAGTKLLSTLEVLRLSLYGLKDSDRDESRDLLLLLLVSSVEWGQLSVLLEG